MTVRISRIHDCSSIRRAQYYLHSWKFGRPHDAAARTHCVKHNQHRQINRVNYHHGMYPNVMMQQELVSFYCRKFQPKKTKQKPNQKPIH